MITALAQMRGCLQPLLTRAFHATTIARAPRHFAFVKTSRSTTRITATAAPSTQALTVNDHPPDVLSIDYRMQLVHPEDFTPELVADLQRPVLSKEERRAQLFAKRDAQLELELHNAAAVPTGGGSRRARRWHARVKRLRTRTDRNRNKQAFYNESQRQEKQELTLWKERAPRTDSEHEYEDEDEDGDEYDDAEDRFDRRRERQARRTLLPRSAPLPKKKRRY